MCKNVNVLLKKKNNIRSSRGRDHPACVNSRIRQRTRRILNIACAYCIFFNSIRNDNRLLKHTPSYVKRKVIQVIKRKSEKNPENVTKEAKIYHDSFSGDIFTLTHIWLSILLLTILSDICQSYHGSWM